MKFLKQCGAQSESSPVRARTYLPWHEGKQLCVSLPILLLCFSPRMKRYCAASMQANKQTNQKTGHPAFEPFYGESPLPCPRYADLKGLTRQHELDHTDQESICPERSNLDHELGTDHTDHLSLALTSRPLSSSKQFHAIRSCISAMPAPLCTRGWGKKKRLSTAVSSFLLVC